MIPQKQFQLLREHLNNNGFKDIELKFLSGEPASRISVNNQFAKLVENWAVQEYGKAVKNIVNFVLLGCFNLS